MPDDLTVAVAAFVADELGVPAERVQADTRLWHDLGCGGGDAAELLAAFGRRFGVELAGFDQGLHFGPAGHLDQSADLQQRLTHPDRLRKRPLTVAHLVAAVQSGRLRNSEDAAV
jgi:hypothetical protein